MTSANKRRSPAARLLITLGIIGGSLFVIALLWAAYLALAPDGPPPDDADLMPHALTREPHPDNPAPAIQKLVAEDIDWGGHEPKTLLGGAQADSDFAAAVAEIVELNADTLKLLRDASEVPQWDYELEYSFTMPTPFLTPTMDASKILRLNAKRLAAAGDIDGAIGELETCLRIGGAQSRTGCNLIFQLVAVSISAMGEQGTLDLVENHPLTPAQLTRLQTAIASCEHDPDDFADAFRGEYLAQSNLIGDLEGGDMAAFDQVGSGGKSAYFLQPNNTRELFAQVARFSIEGLQNPDPDREDLAMEMCIEYKSSIPFLYLRPNAVGKVLFSIATPATSTISKSHHLARTRNRLVLTRIAIARFQLAEGRYPNTLAELVPTYLDAVPPDPFDGQPLRYLPKEGLLYGIGNDFTDKGGTPEEPSSETHPLDHKDEPAIHLPGLGRDPAEPR